MAKVAEYKKELVSKFAQKMVDYPIIGVVNMESLPAAQLVKMRSKLRDKLEMIMTKKRLMNIAIDNVKDKKPGIEKLREYMSGMPALIFTKENPFTIFKIIKQNKSKAPAKPGQTAPIDIEIKSGPTPFSPGPVISELGALGLKTKVVEGKINILEDHVIVKEGEEIAPNAASMMLRLGIEPMEVGLNFVAAYEDGVIYDKKVLDIDEEQFLADLGNAGRWALNLSVEIGYITKDNVETLIVKSFNDSKALALSQVIMADAVVDMILAKADSQMRSVAGAANYDLTPKAAEKPEEKPAEVPAEPAPEAPKEEAPEEKAPAQAEEKPAEAPAEEKGEDIPAQEEKPAEEPKAEPEDIPVETPEEEPEVKEEKAEDVPVEEPKVEDKEAEKPEPEADEKVKKMVEDTKKFASGKRETAESLLEEADES